jgi:hypothetical protein
LRFCHQSTWVLRKVLSLEHPPITPCIDVNGLVRRLIQFLSSQSLILQFEVQLSLSHPSHAAVVPVALPFVECCVGCGFAFVLQSAWALTNLLSGNSEETMRVVSQGVLPAVASLLHRLRDSPINANAQPVNLSTSSEQAVVEQCVWLLGNVAGDSASLRDTVLNQCDSVLPHICYLLEHPQLPPSMARNCVWAMSNLMRGKPQPAFHLVAPALPTLARVLATSDEETLVRTRTRPFPFPSPPTHPCCCSLSLSLSLQCFCPPFSLLCSD